MMNKIFFIFCLPIFSLAASNVQSITDSRDGRVYKTVKIGSQVWMAENLNYAAEGSTCPKNKSSNCEKYGRLYSVNSLDGLCPQHFQVPGKEDWLRLFSGLGIKEVCESSGYEGEEEDECDYIIWKKAVKKLNAAGFNIKYAGEGYDIGESAHFVAKGFGRDNEVVFFADNGNATDDGGNGGQTGTYSIRCVEAEADVIDKILKDVTGLQTTGNAEGGSGGMGDGLAGMLSGDGDGVATKAKGSVKTPSESDIDVVSSSRSAEDIVKVVHQRTPGLRHIYNKFLKQKSGFQGSVTLKFTIAPGGEVVSISIVSSMTGYDKFDDEIKTAVSRWKFGKVKSGSTTVVIPFTFSQEK